MNDAEFVVLTAVPLTTAVRTAPLLFVRFAPLASEITVVTAIPLPPLSRRRFPGTIFVTRILSGLMFSTAAMLNTKGSCLMMCPAEGLYWCRGERARDAAMGGNTSDYCRPSPLQKAPAVPEGKFEANAGSTVAGSRVLSAKKSSNVTARPSDTWTT